MFNWLRNVWVLTYILTALRQFYGARLSLEVWESSSAKLALYVNFWLIVCPRRVSKPCAASIPVHNKKPRVSGDYIGTRLVYVVPRMPYALCLLSAHSPTVLPWIVTSVIALLFRYACNQHNHTYLYTQNTHQCVHTTYMGVDIYIYNVCIAHPWW